MRKYALFEAGLRTGFVYRLHYFATLLSAPISLLIYFYLWSSIYAYSNATIIQGFTFEEIISYYVLAMIVGFVTWSSCDNQIEEGVVDGDTIIALLKPFSFMAWHYFFELGFNGLALVIELVPVFVVGLLFGLKMATAFNILLFIIAIVLAMFLYFLITFLVGLTSFWLFKIGGLRRVKRTLLAFLGGSMLPLTFFPESVQKVFIFLPFQYLRYVPVNIYLDKYTMVQSLGLLAIALIWVLILYGIALLVWRSAFKKFAGAGT